MLQYIEQFIVAPIATQHIEDEIASYYDQEGNLLVEAYFNDGEFYFIWHKKFLGL